MSNELVEKVARAIAEASNYDLAYTPCKQYAVAALSAIQQDTVAGEVERLTAFAATVPENVDGTCPWCMSRDHYAGRITLCPAPSSRAVSAALSQEPSHE